MTQPRANPEGIRNRIAHYSAMSPEELGHFSSGMFGACLGILDELTQKRRYKLIEWLYPDVEWGDKVSTSKMSDVEKIALLRWILPTKATDTSPWTGDPALRAEINAIFTKIGEPVQARMLAEGQEHLGIEASAKRVRDHFVKTFKGIPIMVCGCDATGKTVLGKPFCVTHATRKGRQNSDAYIVREIKPIEDKLVEELGYG